MITCIICIFSVPNLMIFSPLLQYHKRANRRLPIFRQLAMGEELSSNRYVTLVAAVNAWNSSRVLLVKSSLSLRCLIVYCRSLPHILSHKKDLEFGLSKDSEQCWRSLLLEKERGSSEWDMVREHFENSRSKKVLSIIQQ